MHFKSHNFTTLRPSDLLQSLSRNFSIIIDLGREMALSVFNIMEFVAIGGNEKIIKVFLPQLNRKLNLF